MNNWERRYCPRYRLRVPVKFRCLDLPVNQQEHETETSNISRTGLFFVSRYPLQIGASLELFFRLPTEILGGPAANIQCLGHAVRKQIYSDGTSGYGVRTDFRPPVISQSLSDSAATLHAT